MKQYFTKRQVNKILSKNTDGVSTSLSSERLSYDNLDETFKYFIESGSLNMKIKLAYNIYSEKL